MSTFLVTGASGMVGSRIVRELSQDRNSQVIALDKHPPAVELQNVHYITLDFLDEAIYHKILEISNKVDYVIHLAAITDLKGHSLDYYDFNYTSILRIKELSDLFDVKRVVFSSTQLVKNIWLEGDNPPSTLYGESKRIAELLISSMLPENAVVVRLTTVWGEGHNEHYDRFIQYVKKGLYFHSGKRPVFKSYSYIGNCAYQIVSICKNNKYNFKEKVIYIHDPEPIEIRKYVDDICLNIGAKMPISLPRSISRALAIGGDILSKIGIKCPFNSYRFNNILCSYVYNTEDFYEIFGQLPYTYDNAMKEYGAWLRNKI